MLLDSIGHKMALDLNGMLKGLDNVGEVDLIFLEEMSSIKDKSVNRVS